LVLLATEPPPKGNSHTIHGRRSFSPRRAFAPGLNERRACDRVTRKALSRRARGGRVNEDLTW